MSQSNTTEGRENAVADSNQSNGFTDTAINQYEPSADGTREKLFTSKGRSGAEGAASSITIEESGSSPDRDLNTSPSLDASSTTLVPSHEASISTTSLQSSVETAHTFTGGHGVCCNLGTKRPGLNYGAAVEEEERPNPGYCEVTPCDFNQGIIGPSNRHGCFYQVWALVKKGLRYRPRRYAEYRTRKGLKRLAAGERATLDK